MTGLAINRPCPRCNESTLTIQDNQLQCHAPACDFSSGFDCPICEASLDDINASIEENDLSLMCPGCRNRIGLRKIKYLIENSMVVDYDHRCTLCNGPTIHRASMNLGHRCFFFPKCSGQTDLFGTIRESFVFLDFETTGLEPNHDHIIEVGALKIDEDGYEHIFQELIQPPVSISPKITQITGIDNDMVKHARPIEPVMRQLREFIGSSKLVIHNADFDMLWLLIGLIRHDIPLVDSSVICTLKWARSNGESHASLGALTKKYGIGHANAHRALADAAATRELFFIFDRNPKTPRPILESTHYLAQVKRLLRHSS